MRLQRYRKLIAALLGGAASVAATGLIHGQALTFIVLAVAAATGAGVYQVPNDNKESN